MGGFKIILIVIVILCVATFIFSFLYTFSPKVRGKMMSKQVKATKYMMDESKEDIESISTNMADATKEAVETTTRAVKKGFTEDKNVFCKYCGQKIDGDSKFCSKCGKEL